ncbi:hypothetical protein J1N35_018838 [Gossypium stocksii]|uniref:Uncharacterized protein n=1 Tax=Gossypium stocksii TaxID=47602 RepID=A0A9D3VPT8_9ROSI|nr:hypothetical protein J1N35_018838 [Gossypium stocksii]
MGDITVVMYLPWEACSCLYTGKKEGSVKFGTNSLKDFITSSKQVATQQGQQKLQKETFSTDLRPEEIPNKSEENKTNNQSRLDLIDSRSTDFSALITEIEQPWDTAKVMTNINATGLRKTEKPKKLSWKIMGRTRQIKDVHMENVTCKRKDLSAKEDDTEICSVIKNNHKKARFDGDRVNYHTLKKLEDQMVVSSQLGSTAANRQADRTQ